MSEQVACDDVKLSVTITDTLLQVGQVQWEQENYVKALVSFHGALAQQKRVYGMTDVRVACIICFIVHAHHQQHRYGDVIDGYTKGLAMYEAAGLKRSHPDVAWVLCCMLDRNMFTAWMANFWNDKNAV